MKMWLFFCLGQNRGDAGLSCLQGHRCVVQIATTMKLFFDYKALDIIIPQSVSYLWDALVFGKIYLRHP